MLLYINKGKGLKIVVFEKSEGNMNTNELFIEASNLPKPLSKSQLYELLDKVKQGDINAIDTITKHNIRLVLYQVTNKFKFVDYDKKDLVSVGNIGLMKAITTFDISKGFEFSAYAARCIDNEILMFLRKLKKDKNIDSMDRVIFHSKDDKKLKIEDTLSDGTDIVEDYERKTINENIREVVNKLPVRDREIIMLYFGFYNDKCYSQLEIANMVNLSQAQVSREITRLIGSLGQQLQQLDIIKLTKEDCLNITEKEKKAIMPKRLKTIYEYFNEYTREQIDEMLKKLSEEEMNLIKARYGEDLNNPVSRKLSKEQTNKFYGSLVPKMKRLLSKANTVGKSKIKNNLLSKPLNENCFCHVETPKTEDEIVQQNVEIITEDDYFRLLELLRTPAFSKMVNMYSPKEIMIASLKLGYVDGKCFSNSAISEFLGIETQEIIDTIKKILLTYKDKINSIIDDTLKIIEDGGEIISPTLVRKKNKK